jgi:hypothetical protein
MVGFEAKLEKYLWIVWKHIANDAGPGAVMPCGVTIGEVASNIATALCFPKPGFLRPIFLSQQPVLTVNIFWKGESDLGCAHIQEQLTLL